MSAGATAEAVSRARAAIAAAHAGRPVVVIDPADRPGGGELVIAASAADVRAVNLLLGAARGLPAVALPADRVEQLFPAAWGNGPLFVDAVAGIGSGLSARDRARTVAAAADPRSGPEALRPRGHVLLLAADPGGVLAHPGRAEVACDLARLAGRGAAGVTCEVLMPDGSEATSDELRGLAAERRLPHLEAGDLVAFRRRHDLPIAQVDERPLDTELGGFRLSVWSTVGEPPHVAVVRGAPGGSAPALVRIHSQCLTGDVLGSLRCDCGPQLATALAAIAREDTGVLLYLPQEGRGIGILDKLRAYALQDQGLDTVDANLALGHPVDDRDYAVAAALLRRLGITRVRLLTNNPAKMAALIDLGIDVEERVPLEIVPNEHNGAYLATKRARMGHLLHAAGAAAA